MTEVLHAPRGPDGQSYFHQTSGLRRSKPSSTSLFFDSPSASPSKSIPSVERHEIAPSHSHNSDSDTTATQDAGLVDASSFSPQSQMGMGATSTNFCPSTSAEPASYTDDHESSSSSANTYDATETSSTTTTLSDSSVSTPTVLDDSSIKDQPSQQVDFLTHEWREEDIWSSWRHIVSNRKIYGERSRLENASWRQWIKTKNNLRTVTPESLNWLKESDITWLYGPLKLASSYPISCNVSEPSSRISKNNSFINKKPILKKRSMSEVMLAQSLSSSSLVREAATTALFHQRRRPRRSDASSDLSESKLTSEAPSRDQLDSFTSRSSSFCETPSEKKHIQFNDVVEQCIAVPYQDLGLDDDSGDEHGLHGDGSSSEEDGGLIMKRKCRPIQPRPKAASRSNSHNGREIIKTLPNTTLKYRTDSPDITLQAQHHTFGGRAWSSSRLSPSPSSETLRPSNPSANFLLPDDEDDSDAGGELDFDDSESSWSFGAGNQKSSQGASGGRGRSGTTGARSSRSHTPGPYSGDDDFRMEGMRRTGSGMFMPDDEEETMATGIFGRVSETINTARDIAHVIWTVGWRT